MIWVEVLFLQRGSLSVPTRSPMGITGPELRVLNAHKEYKS